MSSFGDVRPAILAVTAGINPEKFEVIRTSNELLLVIVKQVSESLQRLGRCIRPRLATPPAAGSLQDKLRVVPLDRGGSEIREEIIPIHQQFPRRFVSRIGQFELPRDKANLLATV